MTENGTLIISISAMLPEEGTQQDLMVSLNIMEGTGIEEFNSGRMTACIAEIRYLEELPI